MSARWVKLAAGYYLDPAVVAVGGEAERLFVRALSWCALVGSPGRVPAHVVPTLIPRSRGPVAELVRHELWVVEDDGYRIRSWDAWQAELVALEDRRRSDRERKRRQRSRDTSRDTSREVTGPEETRGDQTRGEERGTAAAAPQAPPPPVVEDYLPARVLDLRRALEAARLVVRWDRLDAGALSTVDALVERHGVDQLVRAAQATHRPDSPAVFAQAWLATWQALPAPGTRLRVVADQCDLHRLDQPCRGCAADRKAAGQ